MIGEFETFYDKIKEGNNRFVITIPKKLIDFSGLKDGDSVKVMIKKQDEEITKEITD